jgi:hypothetical protein
MGDPIFLVKSKPMPGGEHPFQTGDRAPETGIYRVVHVNHRLPHEVVILKDEQFPRYAKCLAAVRFDLIHAAPDLFRHRGHRIYELPVEEEATAASTQL